MTAAIPSLVAAALAAVAAYTDWRRGLIPNWLTLPPLVIAPVVYFFLGGAPAAVASAFGIVLCGAVPYLMFRREAIGGGDVKLLAAIGAVAGAGVGLEGELIAFLLAAAWAIGASIARGEGLQLLAGAFKVVLRRPVEARQLTELRLGSFIFLGVCASIALQG